MHRHTFSIFIFLVSIELSAQTEFEKKLDNYQNILRSEKIYLHMDKPHYGAGDNIWMKAYIVDGTYHMPTEISGTLYVELINPELKIIDSLLLPIKNGVSDGYLKLSRDLAGGKYRVRAYTNWMRNFRHDFFFSKDIEIVKPQIASEVKSNSEQTTIDSVLVDLSQSEKKDLLVDFMPEGGDLIHGISTKVAIKATDSLGKGIPFKCKIVNANGSVIDEVESNQFGHGLFFMRPSHDSTYMAIIKADTFYLPQVEENGASIRALHSIQTDKIHISALSNGVDLSGGSLIGHQRGELLFHALCEDESSFSITLSKENLSSGIIHLTLFNRAGVPLSERLIFPKLPATDHCIEIKSDKKSYKKRSKVTLDFNARDSIHSASVTINPLEEIGYSENDENIVSYLLLNSDIKGRIESPSYYLHNTDTTYDALDLLMLTQGWSRFNWEELLNDTGFQIQFLPEKGITIWGEIIDYRKEDQSRKADFMYAVPQLGIYETGQTNESGRFVVEGNDFRDSTMVIIGAHGFKGKKNKEDKNVRVNLTPTHSPAVKFPISPSTGVDSLFINKVNKLAQIFNAYMLDKEATMLDEVIVSAKDPIKAEIQERTSLYLDPSHRLFIDSMGYNVAGQSVFDLLRIIPGVRVMGTWPNYVVNIRGSISISGNAEPLFMIDGIPVEKSAIDFLPIRTVEFIDVLMGPKASVYGARGSGGVVLVYTRRGGSDFVDERDPKGVLGFMHPGYSKSKEFYSPQYDQPREEHAIPDYRSTIYWEPNLNFTDGHAEMSFYTSDQKGQYFIQLEGILKNGEPVYETKTIEVK